MSRRIITRHYSRREFRQGSLGRPVPLRTPSGPVPSIRIPHNLHDILKAERRRARHQRFDDRIGPHTIAIHDLGLPNSGAGTPP